MISNLLLLLLLLLCLAMEAKTTSSLHHSLITMPKKKPKGTGRKKIEIKKIENNSSRKVAFSKRRKGMFKKASELCRLCGAEIAVIVFSPKGRPYSFGDRVIDKFMAENDETPAVIDHTEEQMNEDNSSEEMHEELGFWWEQSIEDMDLEEIQKYKSCLEELRYNVAEKIEEMVMRRTCERDFLGVSHDII